MTEKVELHLGDCWQGMADMPDGSCDLILTDPPYGTTNLEFDKAGPPDAERLLNELIRLSRPKTPDRKCGAVIIFCAEPWASMLVIAGYKRGWFRYDLVWVKTMATSQLGANRHPLRAHERILVFGRSGTHYNVVKCLSNHQRGATRLHKKDTRAAHYRHHKRVDYIDDGMRYPTSVLTVSNGNYKSAHPTQKPVELLARLVMMYSDVGDLVFDPFAGSGSTGVVAINEGRRFAGFELDNTYHERACKRLDVALRTPKLF